MKYFLLHHILQCSRDSNFPVNVVELGSSESLRTQLTPQKWISCSRDGLHNLSKTVLQIRILLNS